MIDRSHPPRIVIPNQINVPKGQHRTVAGVPLYTIDCSDIDVVKICFVFNAGLSYQPADFVASATLNMLSEGTARYSARQIAEILDFYGIYFDANIDRDTTIVTFCCLRRFLDQVVDLACEMFASPTFDANELDIYKDKRKQALRIEREKTDYRARELFAQALYGQDHPYGRIVCRENYDILSPEVLKAFFEGHYTRENLFVVLSGKVLEEDLQKIEMVLNKMPLGSKPVCSLKSVAGKKEVYEERQDALQSSVRLGKVLFNKLHPDYIGMQVVATLLGGYFSSRIVRNIREDKGYTYGAFAGMITMQQSGFFAISSEVAVAHTQDAIDEIIKEIELLRTTLVSDDELNIVRNVMIGDIMRVLDGPFGIADVTIDNILSDCDNRYVEEMIRQINTITPSRIKQLAIEYLASDSLTVVVVGKR